MWLLPALSWHGAQGPAQCLTEEAEPGKLELPASCLPGVLGFSFTLWGLCLCISGMTEKIVQLGSAPLCADLWDWAAQSASQN